MGHLLPEELEILLVHGMVVIVAGQSLVKGKVLFKNAGAEQGCRDQGVHIHGQGVVAVAYDKVREVALQAHNHAKACVLVHGGVVEDAVQKGQGIALCAYPLHCLSHLVQIRGAGREDDGFAKAAHVFDEGLVGDVRGGNLVHIHQGIEEIGAFHVKGRGHEGNVLIVTPALELLELVFPEAVVFFEKLVLA